MKFFHLFTLVALLSACAGRQSHEAMALEGRMWYIKTQIPYYDNRYTHDVRMWIEGDTIVEGLRCKKLYKQTRLRYGNDEGTLQVGYCRQEGDKFYQNGELMFDFGLQVGDTFVPWRGMPLMVKAVGDTILADGMRRRWIMVVDKMDAERGLLRHDYWVEGIGSLQMGILTNDFISIGVMKRLLSCSYGEEVIYRYGER